MAQGSKRRGRVFIYLALILILGVALVFILFRNQLMPTAPQQDASQAQLTVETVDVVFTQQPISRGTLFNEGVLKIVPMAKKDLPEGIFYNNTQDVLGKRAKVDIPAGVPLTIGYVVDKQEGSFGAFQIPAGMVAITVPMPNGLSGVAYSAQVGDHVNVLVSLTYLDLDTNFQSQLPNHTSVVTAPGATTADTKPEVLTASIDGGIQGRAELDATLNQPVYVIPSEAQRTRLVSQTLIQDAIVLQVGNYLPETTANAATAAVQPTAEPQVQAQTQGGDQATQPTTPTQINDLNRPQNITLIVSPQDAVTLNYLINAKADLTIILRSAGDDQRVQTEAVTLQYLMDQYNIPVPAKLPYTIGDSIPLPDIQVQQPTPQ